MGRRNVTSMIDYIKRRKEIYSRYLEVLRIVGAYTYSIEKESDVQKDLVREEIIERYGEALELFEGLEEKLSNIQYLGELLRDSTVRKNEKSLSQADLRKFRIGINDVDDTICMYDTENSKMIKKN